MSDRVLGDGNSDKVMLLHHLANALLERNKKEQTWKMIRRALTLCENVLREHDVTKLQNIVMLANLLNT